MKIVLPGGSGQVGTLLARAFGAQGHDVVVLSRGAKPAPWRVVAWDGETPGPWQNEIDGSDVVINLAGRSVNCRYTASHLADMMNSRVRSTRIVGEAISRAKSPPKVWIQASTATIYAHRFDRPNDEATGQIGGQEMDAPRRWKPSIDIALAWEKTLALANTPHTRKVVIRSAMTMSPDRGGIFDVLLAQVRHGLGGPWGNGRQFVSWIHETDFIRAVNWLFEGDRSGVYNLAAPEPLPNREFMGLLRKAWGIRFTVPTYAWMLEIGAVFLRTETELLLKSRRVVSTRLPEEGFVFSYPTWLDAAAELCARWKENRIMGNQ